VPTITVHRRWPVTSDTLFGISIFSPAPVYAWRSGAAIRRSLHQTARAAGVRTRIVPHRFRHTCATETSGETQNRPISGHLNIGQRDS